MPFSAKDAVLTAAVCGVTTLNVRSHLLCCLHICSWVSPVLLFRRINRGVTYYWQRFKFQASSSYFPLSYLLADHESRQADLQWPVNVYSLSFGCLLLVSGRLADILGGRTMFLIGSAWFATLSAKTAFPYSIILILLTSTGASPPHSHRTTLHSSSSPPSWA